MKVWLATISEFNGYENHSVFKTKRDAYQYLAEQLCYYIERHILLHESDKDFLHKDRLEFLDLEMGNKNYKIKKEYQSYDYIEILKEVFNLESNWLILETEEFIV